MKTNFHFFWKTLSAILLIFVMACASFTLPAVTQKPDATQTLPDEEPTTQFQATANASGQTTSEPTTDTSDTGPRCTVRRDLNLRSGPGTAYDPPIEVLPANTEFIPIAYNPVGYPGGSWVQVQDLAGKKKGWVSAGSDFVSCTIDLSTLSSVSVAPPQPKRPNAESSNPSGTCGSGETYDCSVVFSEGFPVQFIVLKDGQEIGGTDGVQSVDFRVDQNDSTIFSTTDNSAAYCFFGGDGPCTPWILEDNVYKWGYGGPAIEAGEYKVNMDASVATPEGDLLNFHWDATVTISLK